MENWRECKLEAIIEFNPKETIQKGSIAKKIEMSQLIPFFRSSKPKCPYLGSFSSFRNFLSTLKPL